MTSERQARIEAEQAATHAMVKEMHEHILGTPGTDGLVTRVAKVEAKQAFFSKLSWAGFVGILGVVVALFKSKV